MKWNRSVSASDGASMGGAAAAILGMILEMEKVGGAVALGVGLRLTPPAGAALALRLGPGLRPAAAPALAAPAPAPAPDETPPSACRSAFWTCPCEPCGAAERAAETGLCSDAAPTAASSVASLPPPPAPPAAPPAPRDSIALLTIATTSGCSSCRCLILTMCEQYCGHSPRRSLNSESAAMPKRNIFDAAACACCGSMWAKPPSAPVEEAASPLDAAPGAPEDPELPIAPGLAPAPPFRSASST